MSTNPFALSNIEQGGSAAAPATDNPFSLQVIQRDQKQDLRVGLQQAVRTNPDHAAEVDRLAQRYPAPKDVLLRNLQDVQLQAAVDAADEKLGGSPRLADYMRTSPWVAKQSHDDLDALTQVASAIGQRADRTAMGTVGDVGVTALKGAIGLPQAFVGLANLVSGGYAGKGLEAVGLRFEDAQKILDRLYSPAQQQSNEAVREAEGFIDTLGAMLSNPSTIATAVGESAPQMLGGAAIGKTLISVAPKLAPWLAAAFGEGIMGAGATAENIRQQTDDGLLSVKQVFASVLSGGGTALFGAVGGRAAQRLGLADLDTVLVARGVDDASAKALKSGFVAAIGKAGISEGVFEELPQSVQEQLWNNWALDKPLGEGVGAAAAQGLLVGLTMGGGFQALAEGSNRIEAKLAERTAQAQAAQDMGENLKTAMQAAATSKLRERNPETFKQLVQYLADNNEGQTPTSVFIDAQVLAQSGVNVAEVFPGVAGQMDAALATNGSVEVPISEVLTAAPGTPLEQVFLQNARATPDGISMAEAEQAFKQADQWKVEADRVMAEAQDQAAWQQSADNVKANLLGQLNTAGRFTADVNEAYATLVRDFYATMAGRQGITPEEMYQRYPLRIAAQGMGGQQLDQITPEQAMQTNVPVEMPVAPEFGEAVGNTPGAQVTENGLLIDLVRFQKPEQEGAQAIRTGVFYLPTGAATAKHYRNKGTMASGNAYGGSEEFKGQTLIRRPLFVKGATGGKAPEVAYDTLKGKGAYQKMRTDVLNATTGWGANPAQKVENVSEMLARYGADPALASEIVRVSNKGNLLPYAVQENIVAHAVREAGHDAVVGYSKGKAGASISEVFDVREQTFPARGMDSEVHDAFNQSAPFNGTEQATTPIGDATEIEVDGKMRPALNSNGQPIHWSVEGVRNFWRWFGDSEVVDEDGKPLVVYHATDADVTAFDPKLSRDIGIHFSVSDLSAKFGGTVYPVYLNVKDHRVIRDVFAVDGSDVESYSRMVAGAVDNALSLSYDDAAELKKQGKAVERAWSDDRDVDNTKKPAFKKFWKLVGKFASENGVDGFAYENAFEGGGESWAVFSPTQIKSATGNSGAFDGQDANILRQDPQRDLVVTHNLTADNLLHAVKMGGIAVPSLAVTKKDNPLTGFGEITLIGPPEMADPKGYAGTKVFGADIYSPRYPSVTFEFTPKARRQGETMLKDGMAATGTTYIDWSEVERDGARELERLPAVLWQFLKSKGVEPTVVRTEPKPLPAQLQTFKDDTRHSHELAADPAFVEAAWAARLEMLTQAYDGDVDAAKADIAQQQENGRRRGVSYLVNGYARDVQQYQRDARQSGQIDKDATRRALENQVREADMGVELRDYAAAIVTELNPNERIFQGFTNSGNRKYIPHTLDNVVKLLKKELRGGENFNYGVGSLRAKFTPQFKSVAEIRKNKDRLISAADFDKIKDDINNEFLNMADAMSIPSETLSAIMEDATKMGVQRAAAQYKVDVGGDRDVQIAEFMTRLRNLPTAYFEAKIMREVDLAEFAGAVVPEGVKPEVLKALADRGVKDVRTYKKGDEADRAARIGEFENQFFQGARGTFSPDQLLLTLNENADLSTFLHESGHFFLEVMADLASQPNAPADVQDDMNRLLKWFGVPDTATWNAMTLDQKRPHHERFAESFEQYLLEGKAPSAELQPLFRKFRAWMVNVYKSLTHFMRGRNLKLSDEVRQVFDRMLAAEDAIAQQEEVSGLLPDFDATNEGIEKLQARSLRDLKWTVNARSRALKTLQKEAANLRKAVEDEVRAEVEAMPVYQAQDAIAKIKGTPTDVEMETIAEATGFTSASEMLAAIATAGTKASTVEGMTDQRMLENFGELATPEAIEEAANDAVHNEARAKSLATELKAQADMLNTREQTGTASNGRTITVNALAKAAKEFAQNLAARRKVKDLKRAAQQHRAAEAKAGKRWQEATAKADTQAAVAAKRDQVLNNATVKALNEAQAEAKKIVEFFRKVTKDGNEKLVDKGRDPDVVNAMRAILAAYDVAPRLEKGALEYMEAVAKNDPAMYAALQPSVQGAINNAKPLSEMTMEELRGLHDEMRAMWHLAKRSRQMEVDGNLLDIEDAADELVNRMRDVGIPLTIPGERGAITTSEEAGIKLQFAKAILSRVEQWAERLDGKFGGPFLRLVFQPVKDAADRYRTDRVAYRKKFTVLLDGIAPTLKPGPIDAPELGYKFGNARDSGTAELLHAILHTGNESNKRKLLLGGRPNNPWATENADGTLDTSRWDAFIQRMVDEGYLTKAHYDFAQGVWDLLEEMKPLAQKTHREVFGRYFAEVTADAFDTPFGSYRGGYVPAQTDSRLVKDAKLRELAEGENESMAYAFPASPSGFTKSRVEYNKPLLLDLRALAQHMDKVLLFSHMQGAVTDVRRLLTDKRVSYALDRLQPGAYEGMLIPWLNRAAKQVVETPTIGDRKLSRFLSAMRSRAGMALMFANLSNTVQQVTGFSLAAVKVKPSLMMSATGQFVANPKQTREAVAGASAYMRDRMLNEVGAMNDAVEQILVNPGMYERAQAWTQRHAYFLQAAVDNIMSPIIWTAAYNQGIEQKMTHGEAVRFADGVIRQTQGSTLPEDISRFESGPAAARLFTQFVSYFNMMANTNATAVTQIADEMGLRKGAGKLVYVALAGLLAPIWVAEAIAQAFKGGPEDEDDDGYLDDWLAAVFGLGTIKGLVATVPIAGQAAQLVVNQFNTNPADDKFSLSPAVSLLESAVRAPKSVYEAVVDDGKVQKAVRDVAAAATMATGLPFFAAARPLGYAAGVATGEIDPISEADAVRGVLTGNASPESKN